MQQFRIFSLLTLLWFNLFSACSMADELDELMAQMSGKPAWSVSAYLRNEIAYRYHEPRTYTKLKNVVFTEVSRTLGPHLKFLMSGRAYYDLVYELFDYDTITARYVRDADQPLSYIESLPQEADISSAEFRELYFDLTSKWLDLRLGKQFIVWGTITGVRIVDEINPQDFSELILPDLLDYRIPLWSGRMNIYSPIIDIEAIWIPDLRFHKAAPAGSEWELLQEVPGTWYPDNQDPLNWEYGIKLSRNLGETEAFASYFYTWDDFPVIFRQLNFAGERTSQDVDDGTFRPKFTRIQIAGAGLRRQLGKQIVNLEAAFVKDKYFGLKLIDRLTGFEANTAGVLRRDHLRYGIAIDTNIFHTEVTPGITQWYIIGHNEHLIQDRFDTTLNLFIRKELRHINSRFELLGIWLVNLKESYLKPKLVYTPSDRLHISVGLDILSGKKSQTGRIYLNGSNRDTREVNQATQFIGNFNKNDRIFLNLQYNFQK